MTREYGVRGARVLLDQAAAMEGNQGRRQGFARDAAWRREALLLNSSEILANVLGERLAESYTRTFSSCEPRYAEIIGEAAKLVLERIGMSDLGVTKHFEFAVIVPGEERQYIVAYNVLAKIRRHVPYSKAAVGLAAVVVRTTSRRERGHVPLGPLQMLAQQIGRRIVGVIVQREKQIAVQLR